MEYRRSGDSNIFTNEQGMLSNTNESVLLPSERYSAEVINDYGITIVPQDRSLDVSVSTDMISNSVSNNQKSYKIIESDLTKELALIQENPSKIDTRIHQLCSSNVEKKLLNILPVNYHSKPSDIAVTKFCSDGTAQKLAVMQGMLKKECNDKPSNESLSQNYITAVEQPNIGICSCFICGTGLPDPNERLMYLDHQKLLGVKLTILQFLSDILCQKVITNTHEINLCQKCSDLINEADSISKQLNKIKNEIEKCFNGNERPKLTYQVIPHFSNIISKANRNTDANVEKAELSLRELALTRPRHRKKTKPSDQTAKSGIHCVKKKALGRPRKPYQCIVCKLKFISNTLLHRHCFKEHSPQIEKSINQSNICSTNIKKKSNVVSEENVNKSKLDKHTTCQKSDFTKLAIMPEIPLLHRFPEQRSVSLPPMPVRPIQPKPQTLYQLNNDGSVMFFMGPVANETAASLITVTPSYVNLNKHFYSCDLCIKKFIDEKSFKMHRIAAHGVRKKKNSAQINDENKLRESSGFDCPLCESTFGSKDLLCQHINIFHFNEYNSIIQQNGKVYKCEHCDKPFTFKYEMEKHKEIHLSYNKIGPHEFVCSVCELRLASKAALKIHLQRFHRDEYVDEKDFLCAKCGYMTHTKRSFSDHARIHNNSVSTIKMQCKLCKKDMLSSSFKIHMRRMHGEAKYSCKICDKKFTVRSDLMRHSNTLHSNLRPYQCADCERKFITSESLRYHKKKIHSNISHCCDICGNGFKLKGELLSHTNQCQEGRNSNYQCSLCAKNYVDSQRLKLHMAVKHKVYKDDVCYEKDASNDSTNCEYGNKEKPIPSDENELTMPNCESEILLASDPAIYSAQSHIENSIEAVPSSALCNIKIYEDVQEDSIVLTSLHSTDTFQSEAESNLESPFTTDNVSHIETVFTDAKQNTQHIEPNFNEHLQNVDHIYVVRQYEESS